jgi:DNA-directed RNA polymerase specialized sigma subunit
MDRKEIQEFRDRVQRKIREIEKVLKRQGPEGYKSGTSYNDYDTIHGSRKDVDMVALGNELIRLKALRDTYDSILLKDEIVVDEDLILKELNTNVEKVRFLRVAQGHTQKEVAEKLGISEQTVRRIEKEFNV